MTEWAFDIETDIHATPVDPDIPAGLDPRAGRITSIAWACDHTAVVRTGSEARILAGFKFWATGLTPDDVVYTWNGGAFDWPYLRHRFMVNDLSPPFVLSSYDDREPKYERLPTSDGVMRVALDSEARHVDVAWAWQRWCRDRGVRWSMKPLAEHLGITPLAAGRGSDVGDMTVTELAAYNLSDVDLTLRLADRCSTEILAHLAD